MNSKLKKSISMLLVAVLVFGLVGSAGMLPVMAKDACGYTPALTMSDLESGSADAVSGESYSISSEAELYSFARYVNDGRATAGAVFYLTSDIKLDKDVTWTPAGSSSANAFEGIFDGCGFAVTNFINSSAGTDYALFGYIKGEAALIKNLGVEGEITGTDRVAGIAAHLSDGGIKNCWSAVDVSGGSVVGGIAAEAEGGSISNCCSFGYVSGSGQTGAIAGSISGKAVVDYCYYVYYGADSAIGSSEGASTSSVYRFASSSTEVLTEKVLTVGTEKTDDLIVLLNEWIDQQNGLSDYRAWVYDTSAQGVGRTDGRYPSLEYPGYIEPVESIYTATASMTALYESNSSGQAGAFYSISSSDELEYFRDYVNAGYTTEGITFFLTKDISIGLAGALNTDIVWIPIGNDEKLAFKGVFDGQGYVLLNNYTKDGNYQGLFGYVDGASAEIKNVGTTGLIKGNDSVGGIVACLVNGSIINCWFDGEIVADDRVGGIVGKATAGNITNCVNFASITGRTKTGGIVGETTSAVNVKYCYYSSESSLGCGEGSGTRTAVVAFDSSGSDFTLQRSVTVGSASGVKLLNVLNHWVTYLALDNSYRFWKIDDSTEGIARLQGVHPTHLFPGDGSGVKRVDEPHIEVDNTKNPYSIIYSETATMTELVNSGEEVIQGGHYSISSADEMQLLSDFVNGGHDTAGATFYLKDDIILAGKAATSDDHGWIPIGRDFSVTDISSLKYMFRGTFDGCGYTVYGLYITNEKGDNLGLFGRVRGGVIKNLGVVGGMVGELNCGGIVGKIDDGTIENCWTAVNIQSESATGGIAGKIDHTVITNCTAYGAMLCYGGVTANAGGIFGEDMGKSTVTSCYYLDSAAKVGYDKLESSSTADIISFTYGFENDDYYCTLERAAIIDDVTTTSLLDALNAWVYMRNNGQYCAWLNSPTLIVADDGANPGHYPRLMNAEVGQDSGNDSYNGDYTATSSVSALYSTRTDGVEGGFYSINGLDDLEALQKYVADGFKTKGIIFFMTRDVDMSLKYSAGTSKSWTPIGDVQQPFQGTFDGQGYTVKYLYINNSNDDQGLFGHVNNGAVIKNLGVCGVVRANVNAGGIVGDFNFSTIANCWSSCEVTALGNNAGGLVGGANMGTIVNCTNYGAVVNSSAYGAIAGYAFGTTIKYCYYLYGTCQQAYSPASAPVATGVLYFNGTSAACILQEMVDVEGTSTRNTLSALKLYVDAHPETNYCYWTVGNTEEYLAMGVAFFPVLISASNTMGNKDYNEVQAYFDGQEYYSVVKAVNAANDSENGGDVTLATNAVLGMHDDISLDENVRLLTGDYSIIIKSDVKVYSMQQLIGMLIVKEDGGISLLDSSDNSYKLFIYSQKNADASCNSQFYSTDSLTFSSGEVKNAGSEAYNLSLQDGEFIVNSTIDSGNPHKIPAASTITVESRATLNVSSNARIRTTGGAVIMNEGTIKIGNATLDRNGGTLMKGVFEDDGGVVSLPFIYKDGYTLRGWSDGTTLYKAGSTVGVQKATTLTAQWNLGEGPDPYPGDDAYSDTGDPVYNIPISVIQSKGGKITPDSLNAAKGENLSFGVKADPGYTIKNVLVDKQSVELDKNSNYNFISVSREHSMIAFFAPITNSAYYDWQSKFEDVKPGDWCYDNVRYVVSAGLFNGKTETVFAPNDPMTRDMVVVVLWRLSGCPVVPGSNCSFADVSRNSYAYEAIRWANYFGIVQGYSDTRFGYGQSVNREQLVTFLFRYAKNYAGNDVSLYDSTNILGYSDVLTVSKGMTQAFQWAIGAGIVNGTTDTTLSPKALATRAQVAAILSRYCDQFINTAPVLNTGK